VLEKYPKEVKLVTKHFPLPNHSGARPGSEASLAAARQGKYWEFHEEIFKDFRDLNDDKLVAIAKNLGLDIEKFNKDRKDPAIQALIDDDVNEGGGGWRPLSRPELESEWIASRAVRT